MADNHKRVRREHELYEAVNRQVASVVRRLPKRLFDTQTGLLHSESTQRQNLPSLSGAFRSSSTYQKLLNDFKSKPITFSDVANTVQGFYRYAMLSHRWGKHEPLLSHISGSVYSLSAPAGISKLQWFCQIARRHGMRWAWSDTCCIDKSSDQDVQRSITSMFAWYRGSAVTIVYFPDVFKSSYDAIQLSEWFTRGWTLQELLAPNTIHFYRTDRKPFYPDLRDFRKDGSMLSTISKVTLIDPRYLVQFEPSMDNARAKLRWMSYRETTVEADKAYCLLGIFGVVIPEAHDANSKWKAYAKLMKEVLRKGHGRLNSGVSEEDVQAVYSWLRHYTHRAKQDAGELQQFVESSQARRPY